MIPPLTGFRAGPTPPSNTPPSKAGAFALSLLLGLGAEGEAPSVGAGAPASRAPGAHGREAGPAGVTLTGAGRHSEARLGRLDPRLAILAATGLPPGVTDLALGRALAAAALAGWLEGRAIDVDPLSVLIQLHLPAVMGASYGSSWWPRPPAPRPAPGGGWVNADLGAPGDADAFARLLETLGPDADAPAVAAAAQAWRLPVCDYRAPAPGGNPPWRPAPDERRPGPGRRQAGRDLPALPGGRAGLQGVTVCDLTAMWAGPLATCLLTRLGATVIKVEPPSRPDGTRARSGRGIRPGGRTRGSGGDDSAIFNALNAGKELVHLDATEDAARLRELARSADVVIDSFSPRVMPQLGLDRAGLGPGGPGSGRPPSVTVSMPAFPPGPARDWVAYGNGIHALSGLGGDGAAPGGIGPALPATSYPDPLAGLEAAATVMAALAGREAGWCPGHLEVSLAATVEPLLTEPAGAWPPAPEDLGARLLAAARVGGAVEARRDGAGFHLYPASPFRAVPVAAAAPGEP